MENQLNDQPLKWIERIKHGLRINKGYFVTKEMLSKNTVGAIFSNIKEREQSLKNFVDMDVSFDNRECLFRLGANSWKVIDKKSPYYHSILNARQINDSPKLHDEGTDHFSSFNKEMDKLENANDSLTDILNKDKSNGEYSVIIKIILECNKTLIKIVKFWNDRKFRNWTKNKNIRKYKENNTWLRNSEWNKLSLFDKIMTRWNFTDKHQCLVPWEEKRLTKEELLLFQEKKRQWRIKRKNELNGNTYKLEIFNEFCHARIINNKLIKNLDITYDDCQSLIKKSYKVNNKSNDTKPSDTKVRKATHGN